MTPGAGLFSAEDITNSSLLFENLNSSEQQDPPMENRFQCFRKHGLHFIHLKAHCLLLKVDEFCILARHTNTAVIGVTETWLDILVSDSEVEIPGYSIVRNTRQCIGGGVCIYICSDIAFNPHPDLVSNSDTEAG